MKVKHSQKMKLKKATISQINHITATIIKGGTRQGDTLLGESGMASHCADVVCY